MDFLVEHGIHFYDTDITYTDAALTERNYPMVIYLVKKGIPISECNIHLLFRDSARSSRDEIFANLPLSNFDMTMKVINETNSEIVDELYRHFVCSIPMKRVSSLLIGREMCPESPFYRHRFPLDLLKVIFAMCEFRFSPTRKI
jgi:hypothetical protein